MASTVETPTVAVDAAVVADDEHRTVHRDGMSDNPEHKPHHLSIWTSSGECLLSSPECGVPR